MANGWLWAPRHADKASSPVVGAEIEYIATEDEQDKYLSCTIRVDYEPPPAMNDVNAEVVDFDDFDDDSVSRRRLYVEQQTEESFGAYEFDFEDRNLQEVRFPRKQRKRHTAVPLFYFKFVPVLLTACTTPYSSLHSVGKQWYVHVLVYTSSMYFSLYVCSSSL